MDLSTIYTKTGRGTRALIKKLPPTAGQILSVMNSNVSAEEIFSKLKKVGERDFELAITWLLEGGFIKTVVKEAFSNSIWAIPSQGSIEVSEISLDEFNLMKETPEKNKQPDSNLIVLSEARARAETETRERAEAQAKAEAEAKIEVEIKTKNAIAPESVTSTKEKVEALAKADAEARERAEAQARAEADARAKVEAKAREEAEAKARAETEAREKAENEAKAKAEALAKADAEARERAEAQARAEADARAKVEAKAREEAEAKARAETEAREKAENEAKAKAEALAKADAEARERAEAQARAEADARAKVEAKAREEAEAKARAETEAREKAENEAKAKAEALAKADAEARERAEAQARAEADARAKVEAKAREEAEAKARAETEAREKAENEAKAKAEALAKADAEARERAEAQARAEADARAKVEAKAREEAEAKARAETEAAAKAAAKEEAKALARAEALAKAEAREKAREEAEAKAREEKEAKARAEAEAIAQAEAEAKAKAEALARAEAEAEAKAKALAKAEARAKRKAATKAKIAKFRNSAQQQLQKLTTATTEKLQILGKKVRRIKVKKASKQWLPYLFAIVKTVLFYSFALLILLVIAAQFINMRMLVKPLENLASENIQEPVKIEGVHTSILPTPHLLLKNVSVGNTAAINMQAVRIYPELSDLKEKFSSASRTPYEIKSIEIDGLILSQNDLLRPIDWAEASTKHNQLKIKQIILENTSIHLEGMEAPNLNGNILLNSMGQFSSASLTTGDKNLTINIEHPSSKYEIEIKTQNWRSPIPPNLIFAELNANGTIENNALTLSPIKGVLYEGDLKANIVVDLAAAWAVRGDFEVNGINLTDMALELKLNSAIDGTLNTNANFTFNVNRSTNQIENPTINGHFKIKNGFIRKVDLIEAMRSNNLGGSTHFTEFSGDLLLSNQSYQFRNLVLQDNQLQATGTFDISPQKTVAGDIYSKILLKSNPIKSRLIITGTVDNLTLRK